MYSTFLNDVKNAVKRFWDASKEKEMHCRGKKKYIITCTFIFCSYLEQKNPNETNDEYLLLPGFDQYNIVQTCKYMYI